MSDQNETVGSASEPVSIKIRENGPLVVTGPISVVDHLGNSIPCEGANTAFCRCGRSSQQPFCDGTHREQSDS